MQQNTKPLGEVNGDARALHDQYSAILQALRAFLGVTGDEQVGSPYQNVPDIGVARKLMGQQPAPAQQQPTSGWGNWLGGGQ